jgi:uncharacterized PurR-regulated membrane protein YhhQ (DUF165 family)
MKSLVLLHIDTFAIMYTYIFGEYIDTFVFMFSYIFGEYIDTYMFMYTYIFGEYRFLAGMTVMVTLYTIGVPKVLIRSHELTMLS